MVSSISLPRPLTPQGVSQEPIRVLHLIHTMAYGGIETAVINWLRKIDRREFEIHLACFANPGGTETPFVEAAEHAGFAVDKVCWSRRKPVLKSGRQLAELLRRYRIDILHTHNCYADCVGLVAAWLAKVSTVATVYVWAEFDWRRNLIQFVDRQVLRGFDKVTAHCEDTRNKTVALGFAAERISTLICGFEAEPLVLAADERARLRRDLGVRDDEVVLGSFARFYFEKKHDALLRCFKNIHARRPNTRLWIAGVGPLEADIRAYCSELGLDSAVTFLGFVPPRAANASTLDLARIMALTDIQVHPSMMEGVPLSLCSGMAAGLPIVASAVGGIPELLSGGNGVLIPADDEAGFAEAVIDLIDDADKRHRIGAAARQFITTTYSLQTAVARVEQTYREMMGRCASASS